MSFVDPPKQDDCAALILHYAAPAEPDDLRAAGCKRPASSARPTLPV